MRRLQLWKRQEMHTQKKNKNEATSDFISLFSVQASQCKIWGIVEVPMVLTEYLGGKKEPSSQKGYYTYTSNKLETSWAPKNRHIKLLAQPTSRST